MKAIRVEDEWAKAGVYFVRTDAMVRGFGVSLAMEFSDDTSESKYILVTDDKGYPLSTNRIHPISESGFAKIERVATIESARHQGAGRVGIEAAEEWIREMGFHKIVITSREEAAGFYEKLGYKKHPEMDPRTLQPRGSLCTDEAIDPRFRCIYMDKELDS